MNAHGVVATLQDRLVFLLSCGAHASAEVLAQGLLIEAPATTGGSFLPRAMEAISARREP